MEQTNYDWQGEFNALKEQAESLLAANPGAQQVIVLRTTKGNLYSAVNHQLLQGDHRSEDSCLQMLADHGDTQVFSLLAMWDNHAIDVTSSHFSLGLATLNPENENARIFLRGQNCVMVKRLKVILPPTDQRPEVQREFALLRNQAERLLADTPSAEAVIILRSAKGNFYSAVIRNSPDEDRRAEDACLQLLAANEDTAVHSVLTLYQNETMDFPAANFLLGLRRLNPANESTIIFRHVIAVQLRDVLPPKFEPTCP